jgi:hypothetical protein
VADRDAKTPLTGDHLFLAGSTGKTFFAALALQLIEEGRLDLEAPIAGYLGSKPWFARLPNAQDVTVRIVPGFLESAFGGTMDSGPTREPGLSVVDARGILAGERHVRASVDPAGSSVRASWSFQSHRA